MEIYIWNTVIVLTKTAFYVGFACIAGYTFFGNVYGGNTLENGERRSFSQITLIAALIAFLANAIWFFTNTGAMVEEGIVGALDLDMISIMWDSSIGDTTLWRLIGLIGVAIVVISSQFCVWKLTKYVLNAVLVICLFFLSYSITLGPLLKNSWIEKIMLKLIKIV